jgi:hypothetical protein
LRIIANSIPSERRLTCESRDIECREISEKRFRDVATEVGYKFGSESALGPDKSQKCGHPPQADKTTAEDVGIQASEDQTPGKALYLVVRHPRDNGASGKTPWEKKWREGCRIESITTTANVAERCEPEKAKENVVYIHRCGFPSGRIPPTITCFARIGEVEHFERRAIVHFIAENVLGESGEGIPATDEQRRAARRQKYYRAPAL